MALKLLVNQTKVNWKNETTNSNKTWELYHLVSTDKNSVGVLVIIIETINKITVNTRDTNYRLNQNFFHNLKTTTELKV